MRHAMAPRLAIRTFLNMEARVRIPDQHLDRGGVVRVAWIVQLRTVGDNKQRVHLGTQFNVFTRVGNAVSEGELAGRSDWNVHEEVDVRGEVTLAEPVTAA